jgi:hypothetical protein
LSGKTLKRIRMTGTDETKTHASAYLQEMLEVAAKDGATAITLEPDRGDLETTSMFGDTGLGNVVQDRQLAGELIDLIVKRTGLARKDRGKMEVEVQGKPLTVWVQEYQTSGEWAYRLMFNPPRQGRR